MEQVAKANHTRVADSGWTFENGVRLTVPMRWGLSTVNTAPEFRYRASNSGCWQVLTPCPHERISTSSVESKLKRMSMNLPESLIVGMISIVVPVFLVSKAVGVARVISPPLNVMGGAWASLLASVTACGAFFPVGWLVATLRVSGTFAGSNSVG